MRSMKALVKDGPLVKLATVARPEIQDGEVLVRVAIAGVCRTDVHIARGQIPCRERVILGHEMAGVVESIAGDGSRLLAGDRVTVRPWFACERCAACRRGDRVRCAKTEMLGRERDGCFAELVAVPRESVFRLPPSVTMRAGAFTEPIAAAAAILRAPIAPTDRVLVLGKHRAAALAVRTLRAAGFGRVTELEPEAAIEEDAFDSAVETTPTERALLAAIRAVRPGGTIVLKSRPERPVAIDLEIVAKKELNLTGVSYGSFSDAIQILASRAVEVEDLLGPERPLEAFDDALSSASIEGPKRLFRIADIGD